MDILRTVKLFLRVICCGLLNLIRSDVSAICCVFKQIKNNLWKSQCDSRRSAKSFGSSYTLCGVVFHVLNK